MLGLCVAAQACAVEEESDLNEGASEIPGSTVTTVSGGMPGTLLCRTTARSPHTAWSYGIAGTSSATEVYFSNGATTWKANLAITDSSGRAALDANRALTVTFNHSWDKVIAGQEGVTVSYSHPAILKTGASTPEPIVAEGPCKIQPQTPPG